jgi:hypothetical protein
MFVLRPVVEQEVAPAPRAHVPSSVGRVRLPHPVVRGHTPLFVAPVAVLSTDQDRRLAVLCYPSNVVAGHIVPRACTVAQGGGELFKRPVVGAMLVGGLDDLAVTELQRCGDRVWAGTGLG